MRNRQSSLCWLLIALALAGAPATAHAQAAPAQNALAPREVDPGVFNTSPLIDRAELRAGRLDIRPGGTRRVHQHDDVQFHLFIPLTGMVQLTIGAQTIDAVPGQVYFIARGTPHGFRNVSGTNATAVEVFIKPQSAASSGDGLATALAAVLATTP
jgi:quercetin dioxygenase-like cupin family protein